MSIRWCWKTEAEDLPRINTEFHGRKKTAFRAGCVSDGINILFGEGPFGKLRDRVSVRSVSLSNWPLNSGTEKSLRCACIALKGNAVKDFIPGKLGFS